MTILSVIQQVCPAIGISVPNGFMASTTREHVELRALANEMAQRIAFDGHDWTKLKTLGTFAGDGVTEAFNLPEDFRRLIKKARLWPTGTPYSPLTHYTDTDAWLGLTVQNMQFLTGAWSVIGSQVHIKPTIAAVDSVQFYYLTDRIVKPATGNNKPEFTDDSDRFQLDERLLKLGIIWQWKANKGQAYAEDMASYEDALAIASGSDGGSDIIVVGGRRGARDAGYAFPGAIVP